MSSLHFVVHPLPGTEDNLNERLKELGFKINCNGEQGLPAVAGLDTVIKEIVIGPSQVGILTEDGRVARLIFSINTEGLDLSKSEQSKGSIAMFGSFLSRSSSKAPSQNASKLARISTGPRRIVRTTSSSGRGSRTTSGVIMGAPAYLASQYVPEDLISQAQVVLQGKSRSLIIRELQRTNLDVNQAVNNLLSRDDEEADEQEESDSYVPDDLISLLDANISVASDHPSVIIDAESMFSEDIFAYSGIRSRSSSSRRERESPANPSAELRSDKGESSKKKDTELPNAVDIADNIQWWPDKSNQGGPSLPKFVSIVALHSELIAVSADGNMHQWRWSDREPYFNPETPNIFHPKTVSLGLLKEKVVLISAVNVRCSVSTESGKIATFMDESLAEVSSRLEQSAQLCPEFQNDPIVSLHTCQLYTCAMCESGTLYWWGVLPFNQRKKLWEKFKGKTKKQRTEISEGAQVGMKSSPMYHPGALAFYMSSGVPKIGKLINAAWNLSQTCRFKIVPPSSASIGTLFVSSLLPDKKADTKKSSDSSDMPPPPSPASSTCSDTGSTSSASRRGRKRQAPLDDDYDEEEWPLKDVIFVEDTRPQPIGEVLAVDGDQVVVVPQTKESKSNLRVYHRNQLQIIRTSGSPRVPDCYQKIPKKIPNLEPNKILSMAVDARGIHIISKAGSRINYGIYNLSSGKVVQESALPTDATAFISKDPSAISLFTSAESENVVILRDGNGTLYPLSRDCANTIKDPAWPHLPPISCLGVATHFLHSAAANQKNLVAFIVLAIKKQTLMPKILKCDVEGVKQLLSRLENDSAEAHKISEEKCDGNHNILHACVSACATGSNKESDSDTVYDKDSLLNTPLWLSENADGTEENVIIPSSSKAGPSMPTLSASDPAERKQCILYILKSITESRAFRYSLRELLTARDSNGLTPFMLAVWARAYEVAHLMLDVITRICRELSLDSDMEKRTMNQMIFPVGSNPDDSPLHVLCYNDTCSFTWTGDKHINQDIFECRTCGLTGSLCCCTECARVCHKGHDCKLKHTSPTAYCDCWQKCKCKALKAGQKAARFELLSRLINCTDLVNYPNGRGENIILFLLQTVRRQVREQKQCPKFRSCMTNSLKSTATDADMDMPDHYLEPPKFSRKALERLLKDWDAIKAMILTGHKECSDDIPSDNVDFMKYQGHTTHLDKFTYCLLVKLFLPTQVDDKNIRSKPLVVEDDERKQIADNMVTTLLNSLVRELYNETTKGRKEEAIKVARRFVSSAVRIYVALAIEMSPPNEQQPKDKKTIPIKPLAKCIKVFETLLPMAICELCEAADALLLPVRMNFVKPTPSFPLANIHEASLYSQEMFEVDPVQKNSRMARRTGESIGNPVDSERLNERPRRRNAIDSASFLNPQNEDQEMEPEREESRDQPDAAESDMELDLLASDSDSDSGAETQRSVQTAAATAGSDPEEDSPDTSGGEEEDEQSEAAETDDIETHELFNDVALERRVSDRNAAPHHLAWAVRRSRAAPSPSIYIEPPSLRRIPPGCYSSHNETPSVASTNNTLGRAFYLVVRQMSALINMACDQVRDSSRNSSCVRDNNKMQVNISPNVVLSVLRHVDSKLQATWDWLLSLMDATEAQLRFGRELNQAVEDSGGSFNNTNSTGGGSSSSSSTSLQQHGSSSSNNNNNSSNISVPPVAIRSRDLSSRAGQGTTQSSSSTAPATSSGRNNLGFHIRDPILSRCQSNRRSSSRAVNNGNDSHIARREALTYVISLLRAHKNEHCDSLPDIDVGALKHVAFVFDALMCYLRSCEQGASFEAKEKEEDLAWDENDNEEDDSQADAHEDDSNGPGGKKHFFFQRSNSTLCLGSIGLDPFKKPINDALPLADKPQLLQPNARKEDLFGSPESLSHNTEGGAGAPLDTPLSKLGIMDNQQNRSAISSPTKDSFYLQLFNSFEQQPTDLSTSSNVQSDYYCDRAPIIMSSKRSHSEHDSKRQGVKSVIVKAGYSPPLRLNFRPYSTGGSSSFMDESSSPTKKDSDMMMHVPMDVRISQSTPHAPNIHDVAANVTIDSVQEQMKPLLVQEGVSKDLVFGRWRLALELFGRVFIEDVGGEPGSVIGMLGGFSIKEAKFRKEMEKLRNGQQKDFVLQDLVRDRGSLINETFKHLNNQYTNASGGKRTANIPPLLFNRVKVIFKDEPGEGTGVARSFFTALAEAILSHEKLPALDSCQVGLAVVRYSLYGQYKGRDRDRRSAAYRNLIRRDQERPNRKLSVDARPFYINNDESNNAEHMHLQLLEMGKSLYPKVQNLKPNLASKITGMLLGLSQSQIATILDNDEVLQRTVEEAVEMISSQGGRDTTNESTTPENEETSEDSEDICLPLFYQPGKRGFYSPRQGKDSSERLNAFRNVGRILGICLLQNELCPIYLNRHVLKFILGRKVRFHDFAFFDPVMFESLRKMVYDAESKPNGHNELKSLDLNFSIDLISEEGGENVELIENGVNVPVNETNVYDYVRKYAQYRMLKCQEKALINLRHGVHDVVPISALEPLTAEDLRLLLNGVGDINVSTLISYTSFNNESTESNENLQRFKKWLWSLVEKMTVQEKQDMLYFWTGSPALPASEEGFQPMPSVTIRPADDSHLPTANTCISRLYIPLYSSRNILRSKLLIAIKTKTFGFV